MKNQLKHKYSITQELLKTVAIVAVVAIAIAVNFRQYQFRFTNQRGEIGEQVKQQKEYSLREPVQ
ncbi:hypothetical protein WA1_31365 [Scytonema hofmannii PCC 7110]|uniref:Uncharacterized protein n=1 Tax=Scytonema hofmannii PCC 7110 TaxID=128403 RepID=A0A139X3K7_9CYAN|nr:hypothetical protein [Scytonema hofmannii]KYC39243.1 hypothetical protein WA1_31365 [Scytonema hofmannii PCC 7110]